MEMAVLQAHLLVRAPLERVFAFAADPTNLGRWLHPVDALTDVSRWPGPGATFRFRWRLLGMSGFGDGRVLQYEAGRRVVTETRCDLGRATWDMEWNRRGVGCRVTLTVNYQPASPLSDSGLETLALQQLLHHHADLSLHSLRALVERGSRFSRVQAGDRMAVGSPAP